MDTKECIWFTVVLATVCLFIAYIIPHAQKIAIEQERIGDTTINTSAAYTPAQKKKIIGMEGFESLTTYVQEGQTRYNPLADSQTVQGLNLVLPPNDMTGSKTNKKIKDATNTIVFEPGETITNSEGVIDNISAQLPGRNKVAEAAKKCEAKEGRTICGLLDDPSFSNECGVCIKSGTRAFDIVEGRWVGGLHVSKDDVRHAQESGIEVQPSAGACPPGYFFTDSKKCIDGVNKLDCEEAGSSGGWSGPKSSIVDKKCAQCAPGDIYVYDPKDRLFPFAIRAISPSGSGRTLIKLYILNNEGGRVKEIGAGEINGGGEVVVNSKEEVKEGDRIEIDVVMEFSTHTVGQAEVFAVDRGRYTFTKETAKMMCESIDAKQATLSQLTDAQRAGADWCYSGHLADSDPKFPTQVPRTGCGGVGVNTFGTSTSSRAAVCFGIKPSVSDDYSITNTFVKPFTEQPSYAESRFGKTNKGIRAILIQIESSNNPNIKIGIEKYLENVPKRYGMFSSSGFITKPRSDNHPKMLKDNYWIWYESGQRSVFKFKMPGTLLPPFYKEDVGKCSNRMLITKKTSIVAELKGACSGQKPGLFTGECLVNLFAAAGGDAAKGKLSPKLGGPNALNELLKDGTRVRTEDEISTYCFNLYTIATTGKNLRNEVMSKEMINSASDKMFGFVIASPCEDIEVSNSGIVGLRMKTRPLPVECLDYLYKNAGSEQSKGFEEDGRQTKVKATYSTIGARFSGLRKNEFGATEERKAISPFKTCTSSGTIAPITKSGINNKAVETINRLSDGSVEGVQTLYDRVFQQANKDGSILSGIGSTLEACFGIFKSPGPATFDLDYDNLMKTLYEPRTVSFKLINSDAGLRHTNFLLIASGSTKDDLYKKDSTFKIVKALNGKDGFISLESINFPGFFLRHAGFRFFLNMEDRSTLFGEDSSFKIVRGINKDPKTISLVSSNYPDRFITVDRTTNAIWLVPVNSSIKNALDNASFILTCPNYRPANI